MKRGYQKDLANKTGLTVSYISEALRGKRNVSVKAARKLEAATGVSRLAWLYPDEFPNPMLARNSQSPKDGAATTAP